MQGLHVHPERMERNLNATNGLLLSEQVMLALGHSIGRQAAHDVVYACAMVAIDEDRPFRDVLAAHPIVAQHLTPADLDRLLDPHHYTGLAITFVNRVLEEYHRGDRRDRGERRGSVI
jgi:adenylosuccinate lyase